MAYIRGKDGSHPFRHSGDDVSVEQWERETRHLMQARQKCRSLFSDEGRNTASVTSDNTVRDDVIEEGRDVTRKRRRVRPLLVSDLSDEGLAEFVGWPSQPWREYSE
jgi:hypothetical protein